MSTPRSWYPGPSLRIGDAEREAAAQALGEHYAVGRLTRDEYDESLFPTAAYKATRYGIYLRYRR